MRHLRYFQALARHRHFGRAAEASAISQPALSQQIKELEAILGAPLVERGPRRISLTPLGEKVAERARAILSLTDELAALARVATGSLTGRLRLGVIPTIAPYYLPPLIRHLSRHFPDLSLRPREAVTRKLLADLSDGRLDLALVALPISEPGLAEYPLFEEEFLLVRPQAEAHLPVPPVDALRHLPLLLLEEGHCFRDQAISFCKLQPGLSGEILEGSSLSTLVQMVGAGIGVTLIPRMAAQVEARSAAVALQRLPEPRASRTVGLVWRRSDPLAAQLAELAATIPPPDLMPQAGRDG